MIPTLTDADKTLHDQILQRIACPHISMGMIEGRWSFFYSDPETGIHDYRITVARDLSYFRRRELIALGRKFSKKYYSYPFNMDVVIARDDVVHHVHMTSRPELTSFEAFAHLWYRGTPRLEDTDVPYEDRTLHQSLWEFYAAIGWDYKKKQFPPLDGPFPWPREVSAALSQFR